jgi:hypothetical protein
MASRYNNTLRSERSMLHKLTQMLSELRDDPSLPWDSYPCLLWAEEHLMPNGYGRLSVNRKNKYTHRTAWEITHGSIPEGLSVLHHCDIKRCFRPCHLFVGTQLENMEDKVTKFRQANGERIHCAKLSSQQVLQIRELFIDGVRKQQLAERFGVTRYTIYRVLDGSTWKHI